jgi:putative ABC transport system substrate-binding protein
VRRREFISLLGGAGAAWPLSARGQQAGMPVVGFINGASPAPRNFVAFVQGLKEAGFVDRQNVLIEARWAEGNYARLPAMVEELIGRHVALIVTTGGLDPARAAQTATATIPIVFVIGGDPVKFGLVESLNHPGGNLTGIGFACLSVGGEAIGAGARAVASGLEGGRTRKSNELGDGERTAGLAGSSSYVGTAPNHPECWQ